jgi:hypothetical protein
LWRSAVLFYPLGRAALFILRRLLDGGRHSFEFFDKNCDSNDEKSRKDFDEGLRKVQNSAAEFGEKIGALPAIVSDATKRLASFSRR